MRDIHSAPRPSAFMLVEEKIRDKNKASSPNEGYKNTKKMFGIRQAKTFWFMISVNR